MGTISERLKNVIGSNVAEFCKEHELIKSSVYKYLRGRMPPADFIAEICVKAGINEKWLLTGEGPIYKNISPEDEEKLFSRLMEKGFLEKPEEVLLVLDIIAKIWEGHREITGDWGCALMEAAYDVVGKYKVRKEGLRALEKYFPFPGKDMFQKIGGSLLKLKMEAASRKKMEARLPLETAKFLYHFVKENRSKLNETDIKNISRRIFPWCLWVGRRYFLSDDLKNEMRSSFFEMEREMNYAVLTGCKGEFKDEIFSKSGINLEIIYSIDKEPSSRSGIPSCSFGISVPNSEDSESGSNKIESITIGCGSLSFVELKKALEGLDKKLKERENVERGANFDYGEWSLSYSRKAEYFRIQRGGIRIYLKESSFFDLISLIQEAYSRDEIKLSLMKSFVDRYGAV